MSACSHIYVSGMITYCFGVLKVVLFFVSFKKSFTYLKLILLYKHVNATDYLISLHYFPFQLFGC